MPLFRNMAIKHKLEAVIMLTSIFALLLTGVVFIAWEWNNLRKDLVRDLSTHTEMIADNCKAALAFEDTQDAQEALKALRMQPSIVFAGIYSTDGKLFASYYHSDADYSIQPPKAQKDSHRFTEGFLTIYKSVILDKETIGTACLKSDLKPLYATLKREISIIAVVILFVSLCAYLISAKLQRIISKPILSLADTAKAVSEKKDFATRAEKQNDDEVGSLIDAFNEMLEQIQQQDSALRDSRNKLEEKVKERTEELSSTNVKLAEEVAERSSTQKNLQRHLKQLNCFYGLSQIIEQPKISLDQIFQQTVHLIRGSYQNPDNTCVRITFSGIQYKTDNFKKTEISQHAEINIRGEQTGSIEVYYVGEKPEKDKEPFLKEEQSLLKAVGEHLGRIVERNLTKDKLQLFRNLIDHSNDAVFVIGPEWGRLLDVNNKACESLGYTREELLNMTLKDIDESILDDAAWTKHVKQARSKGSSVLEGLYKRKDNTKFPAEMNVAFIEQQKKSYILAVARDITERKKAEERQKQLLEKVESINKELKDFAYIVSHDLKAPLRAIRTITDWITSDYADKLNKDGKEQIGLLSGRVDRMHSLIEGVLQYSRVGYVQKEMVQVNLNDLVPDIIDSLAPPENIKITVEDKLPTVECDETRIIQVFQNLLSNAVKYMDKPKGQIKIGCAEENSFWKFSIEDNGPGIDEKHFEKIFQIFQTLSPRDEFESTGIGLTVVKKIIELYGGKIRVESKVGKGTTFFFTLPKQKIGNKKNEKHKANITH
ncbi:MAG: ATP-binding protein [Planctomycetota bacterium]